MHWRKIGLKLKYNQSLKARELFEQKEVSFAKEKAEMSESIGDLTQAKEILLTSKVELQNRVEDMEK